jgi:thiol-disulfide isomerase/thioredoxin
MHRRLKYLLATSMAVLLASVLAWAVPKTLSQTRGAYRPVGESGWIPLKTNAGHPVLLVFWASWCLPCVSEIPNLNSVFDKFEHAGLKIIAVNLDQDADEELRRTIQRHRIRYPVVLPSTDLIQEYEVSAIPAVYLYDKTGALTNNWIGPPGADELERAIQAVVQGGEPAPSPPPEKPAG